VNTSQVADEITVDLGPPRDPMNIPGIVTLDAGNGADLVYIERVAPGWGLVADGGAGDDTFLVSPSAQDLNTIRGRLTVDGGVSTGGVPSDALVIYDETGSDPGRLSSYTVTSTMATRGPAGAAVTVNYRNIGYLQVDTSNNADTIRLELAGRLPTIVYI